MTCSHMAADEFTVFDQLCPHCGHVGYVEFHTCSCIRGAAGECEVCDGEIRLVGQDA